MAGAVERRPRIRGGCRYLEAEILRARNVAVSLGNAAHGAHAQLHDRRRDRAFPAHAGFSCDSPDGMGRIRLAGGKRGHSAGHPPARVDQSEYRVLQARLPPVWIQLRLAARDFHVRTGILQVEPVVFPAHAGKGNRLPQAQPRELVPEMRDGAGERAGGERVLLAARRYASRRESDRAVVPAHHAIRR